MTLKQNNQDGIFGLDEKILWRGGSDTSVPFQLPKIKDVGIGLMFIVLGIAGLIISDRNGDAGLVFWLLLVLAEIWIAFGWVVELLKAKDPTSYFVTGCRACRDDVSLFGKSRLPCVEFTARTEIELKDGDPPSVLISNINGEALVFQDMYDAHHVLVALRGIQKELS